MGAVSGSTVVSCGACGGPIAGYGDEWRCAYCHVPVDVENGTPGVSRGHDAHSQHEAYTVLDFRSVLQPSDEHPGDVKTVVLDMTPKDARPLRIVLPQVGQRHIFSNVLNGGQPIHTTAPNPPPVKPFAPGEPLKTSPQPILQPDPPEPRRRKGNDHARHGD